MNEQRLALRTIAAWGLMAMACGASVGVAQTVTVDNRDAGFSVLSGEWSTGTYPTPHGADYHYSLTTTYSSSVPLGDVEWRPELPSAGYYEVSTWYVEGTNRSSVAPFTVHHSGGDTLVEVDEQINGSTWVSLGAFWFDAGTGGSVGLHNDTSGNVVIADAVRFTPVTDVATVTVLAYPATFGVVSPAGSAVYPTGAEIEISAYPLPGYLFERWAVTAGELPADPYASTTTVAADESKTVAAIFAVDNQTPEEFRGVWIDAFGFGFKSEAEIDSLISRAVNSGYNAIIPEILAHQDTGASGHGAYWDSAIVPRASDIVGAFDPLAYMIQQAHANGLEVHPWLVAFRVCSSWPPNGNSIVAAHPEWLMTDRSQLGTGPATVGTYYTFDPGSPGVQDYLMSIVREICANYEVDGIHWDYIRYTQTNAGYPTDNSYSGSSLARFQEITGRSDVPSPTGDGEWNDFRRRTVTEVVRRAMTEVATADNPRQPLRHSAACITWAPATVNFQQTNAYALFSNWENWQAMGYLDATIPMTYFDEPVYGNTYRAWVDNAAMWAAFYNRHTYTGLGIYLNTFEDSKDQVSYALGNGAKGVVTYSYRGTNDEGAPWYDWYNYIAAQVFTQSANIPEMPWRDPATSTEGVIYGRVAHGLDGRPIDDAAIYINGQDSSIRSDGTGFFSVRRTVSGADASFAIKAVTLGEAAIERTAVLATGGGYTEANLAVGSWRPGDFDVDGDVDLSDYMHLAECMTGPAGDSPAAGCDVFDIDTDGDIDLADVSVILGEVGA